MPEGNNEDIPLIVPHLQQRIISVELSFGIKVYRFVN